MTSLSSSLAAKVAAKNGTRLAVDNWSMISADSVEVQSVAGETAKSANRARIIVNDGELDHTFGTTSRISKALQVAPVDVIAERLTGGKFFTINDDLIDFRDNHYNGFVHNSNSIQRLIETIGVSERGTRGIKHSTTQGNIQLSSIWGNEILDVPIYNTGGVFNSHLRYSWSPFGQNIRGIFELVRMICTNGMVGLTNFFNAKIPMINRWDEHMDIAYKQIQNKVQGRVKGRIIEMGKELATVGELMQIADHASDRLKRIESITLGEATRLENIENIANPKIHLLNVYKSGVFEDKSIANRVPGHLTAFDAWNLVTEMYSHTSSNDDSSDIGLQRLANALMFDSDQRNKRMITIFFYEFLSCCCCCC